MAAPPIPPRSSLTKNWPQFGWEGDPFNLESKESEEPPPPIPPRSVTSYYSRDDNILQQIPPPPSYLQYGYQFQSSMTTVSRQSYSQRFFYPTTQGPNVQPQVSTNNNIVLNFMQKKPDSNLIDLVCSYNDILNKEDANDTSLFSDDILKLFDPLSSFKEDIPLSSSPPSSSELSNNKTSSEGTKSNSKFSDWETFDSPNTSFICDNNNESPIKTFETSQKDSEPIVELKVFEKEDAELLSFRQKLIELRSEFKYEDYLTNTGLVISPTIDKFRDDPLSIKLSIDSEFSCKPISFTCDIKTSTEHIISHVVCSMLENVSEINMDNYVLKVYGIAEYLSADSCLEEYEYVHHCHKFDEPVQLTLIESSDLKRDMIRTEEDDRNDVVFELEELLEMQMNKSINCSSVNIVLDILKKESEKMRGFSDSNYQLIQPQGVVQAVKAICTLLCHIETPEITESVEKLIETCLRIKNLKTKSSSLGDISILNDNVEMSVLKQQLNKSLNMINEAIHKLLLIYSHSFKVDFWIPLNKKSRPKDITNILDTLLLNLGPVLNVPSQWNSCFDQFNIKCDIVHGTQQLASVTTSIKSNFKRSFFFQLSIDSWIEFENLHLCILPRETKLFITVYGLSMQNSDSKDSIQNAPIELGWCGLQMLNFEHEMVQGGYALGFWPPEVEKISGPTLSNLDAHCPYIYIAFPEYEKRVRFPKVIHDEFSSSYKRDFESLDPQIQAQLMEAIELDSLTTLTSDQKEVLWAKRHYLYKIPKALPKVLESAHGWSWACLGDIYSLLKEWSPLSAIDAISLLSPSFPDIKVRETAVKWLNSVASDELCNYLPQLVQILRYEPWEDSDVAWFLLRKSLMSIRIAHQLYWQLKQNLDCLIVKNRIAIMLNSLMKIIGKSMRERFIKQEILLNELSIIAGDIKTMKDGTQRANALNAKLDKVHWQLANEKAILPLGPGLEVCGLDVSYCSYFNSNTLPLKLIFLSPEKKSIEALYKVGDDLRQDALTIQMIQLMNKLWLKEKLDLKIVTFACIPTDFKKGIVEMVKDSETLRKIHTEYGLAGSFKHRSIAEWLQKHNTSELEYQQAVENFTLSCAGYCVATYILGVCDRHNDNIMLKTSGHIFHIDFGKFLGDSQMFGSIRRDRVPFVLTPDMAFVINGGDKYSKKFQNFIDLCCQAFNIIRKHSFVFLNLFSMMVHCSIPGVSLGAVSYVQKALLPGFSEAEAMAEFAKMIQESLKSWFTQINFFIHNLSQMRFSGEHTDPSSLSFAPKTFTRDMDGKITSLEVIGCQKRYDPEKYYIYIIKVKRENTYEPQIVSRSYREFIEFNQKMIILFPLAKFISLSRGSLMGRSNVREVAEKRKSEIIFFLNSILDLADEISHCNLFYTFFHPLLRDQEGLITDASVKEELYSLRRESMGLKMGQVKLSIIYKKCSLLIMVMHAKNLVPYKESAPDSYVKTYLLPDPTKSTKRKTKVVFKTAHPTFMEMLVYNVHLEEVRMKTLHVSLWSHDRLQENGFLGAICIPLKEMDLAKDTTQWYPLEPNFGF